MNALPPGQFDRLQQSLAAMDADYNDWRPHHQEVARYILPRRYSWLYANSSALGGAAARAQNAQRRNEFILDGTATRAVQILAAGMMNGITSPVRPWFELRIKGFKVDELDIPMKRVLEENQRRLSTVLNESNFYSSVAMNYLDMCAFGTAGCLLYEDFDDVVRFYPMACGEYRLTQDDRKVVNGCGRSITMTVAQVVSRFGLEAVSARLRDEFNRGGAALQMPVSVSHLIEPNDDRPGALAAKFKFREYYWETSSQEHQLLSIAGFHEMPGIFPRWMLIGNDTYGTSPSMDALADIIQLQHMTKRTAQSLDYMVQPPMIADAALQNRASAFLPRSVTYVPSSSSVGAKPAYQINPPIAELAASMRDLQTRIKEFYHNDLFQMISQLETVRTATEIDARREEKLVMLGPVYQRFEHEALDPMIRRVYSIMERKQLLAAPPPGYEGLEIEIQYVSVIADAQRAVGTGSIERFFQLMGQLTPAVPDIASIPDYHTLIREYANELNVPALGIRSKEEIAAEQEQKVALQQAQQAALVGEQLTKAGANLAGADIGGGQNALQALLGG